MKIEEGKYYRTRDGRKAYIEIDDGSLYDPFSVRHENGERLWHKSNGEVNIDTREDDLIAEWTDETPNLSAETIDAIAIDSLKFHMDQDMEPLERESFRVVLRYYGGSV
jgi:hypothetical protein